MRTLLLSLVAVVGVAACCLVYCAAVGALGQDKKPAEKLPAAEVEALVKQLSDPNFVTRERASMRLEQAPGVLSQLRPFAASGGPETRRRVEGLLEKLTARNFKALFREVVNRKHEAPLDLLVDLVVENSERMDHNDWKAVLATIGRIKANVLKGSKVQPGPADPERNFLIKPLRRMSIPDLRFWNENVGEPLSNFRVDGSRIEAGPLNGCMLVATDSIDAWGNDSILVARNSIESQRLSNCIVLTNGKLSLRKPDTSNLTRSFVFSAGDVVLDGGKFYSSLIISGGRVKPEVAENCVFVEDAANSSLVTLFSMKALGFSLLEQENGVRANKIAAGSWASKHGFEVGDIVTFEGGSSKRINDLERTARKLLASDGELVFQVSRQGRQQKIVFLFSGQGP